MAYPRKAKLRRVKRRYKKRAKKAVDRRQNRNISNLYKMVKYSKERKYVDKTSQISLANNYINMLGTETLTSIDQGQDGNTRNGAKIMIHSHHIKVIASVGDSTNLYRFLVIRFLSQPASLVQISDALENVSASTPLQLLSPYKRNTDCRYQILYDSGCRTLAGNGITASTAGVASQRVHNILIKPKNGLYAAYSGNTGSSVVQGFTYLIGCTDSAIAPQPRFNVYTRTIFSG